jgi:hypothetical protein
MSDEKLFYVIYKKNKVDITKYFKKNGVIKKEYKNLIQQKSKKGGTINNKFILCSFNIYTWIGYKSNRKNFDTQFNKLINEKNVELLLTQEDDIDDNDDTYESVKAYSLNDINSSRFSFISCINSHNEGKLQFYRGVVPRNAIIIKDNEFGISIANLHLEGGRFVDLELDDITFNKYLDIKLGLLKEVLRESPDIILGDFNSVYCNDSVMLKNMYEAQKVYYDKNRNSELQKIKEDQDDPSSNLFSWHMKNELGLNLIKKCAHRNGDDKILSLENIISWNNAPFTLLLAEGYIYIEPDNITVNKKINPTNSRGKNVIDHVWVKQSIFDNYILKTEIYDGLGEPLNDLYGGVSDHKPIILTIQRRNLDGATKKRRIR